MPELQAGAARIVVTATRPSFLNLRTLTSTATKDVQVRLEPPRIAVVSTHHYVNHGGSRDGRLPRDAARRRVGRARRRRRVSAAFPRPAPAITGADPALHVAFFALLHDQDLNTPIVAFARDAAGNEATATFVDNVFEKPFKHSRIEIDDKFLNRVVPEILEHSPELKMTPPPGSDHAAGFLKINGELRRMNADEIVELSPRRPSPTRLWNGPFVQLGNSQVEAQLRRSPDVLLQGQGNRPAGASRLRSRGHGNVAVLAANAGTVLNASWLGIYGNCVIIDHGMGVRRSTATCRRST